MARCMRSSLLSAAALATLWCDASALRKGAKSRAGKAASAQASRDLAGVPLYMAEQSQGGLADEWMVAFGPKATDATLEAFCAKSGPCTDMGHPDEGGIPFVVVRGSEQALGLGIMAHKSDVAFVEQDSLQQDFGGLEGTLLKKGSWNGPWNLEQVGVPYTGSNKGKGVNVYVLDTGIRVSHKEFGGRAIPLLDARKKPAEVCDPVRPRGCARDINGHGTHVAGTVGGKGHGVAPEATLYAVYRGRSMSDGYGCIDWIAQNRQRPAVLSLSFGLMHQVSDVARLAVDAAIAASITVVAGAGNNNDDACDFTFATFPNLISVGASDFHKVRTVISNFGPCVDLFAPGQQIHSAGIEDDEEITRKAGTSMATPHVSGAAALILELNPEMSPAQVKEQIMAAAQEDAVEDAKGPNFFLQVASAPPTTEAPEAFSRN